MLHRSNLEAHTAGYGLAKSTATLSDKGDCTEQSDNPGVQARAADTAIIVRIPNISPLCP